MDNLESHNGAAVRAAIVAAGAELRFLPPCSPDFNPIESAFATLKANSQESRRPHSRRPLDRRRPLHRSLHARAMRKPLRRRSRP